MYFRTVLRGVCFGPIVQDMHLVLEMRRALMGATRGHKAQIKRVWAKVVKDSQEAASEIGQKTASQLWGFCAAQQHHLQSMPTASDCEISQKVQAASRHGAPGATCVLPLCLVLRIIRENPFFSRILCGVLRSAGPVVSLHSAPNAWPACILGPRLFSF